MNNSQASSSDRIIFCFFSPQLVADSAARIEVKNYHHNYNNKTVIEVFYPGCTLSCNRKVIKILLILIVRGEALANCIL